MTTVNNETGAPPQQQSELATAKQVTPLSPSEMFTKAVEKEFASNAGSVSLTPFQKKLCQNYFIKIDTTLKELEIKRLATAERFRDALSFTWDNINLPKLAIDVISYSAVGLDALQPNHINTIPFKNNKTNKYDITFIIGYKGTEIKARKYGLDIPDDVIVELVYSNDKFKQIKKDLNNKCDNYTFEIVQDFNRGELVGAFYYHSFFNNPQKNKIETFSKADIDKRKPKHASVEFWGGQKDEYVNGQKTGQKIEVEGWYDEMAYKTIYRAAYNAITIDSQKIDQAYLEVIKREMDRVPEQIAAEINKNANGGTEGAEPIGFDDSEAQPQQINGPEVVEPVTMNIQPVEAQPTEKAKAPF